MPFLSDLAMRDKRGLLSDWISAHAPGNFATLFASRAPLFALTSDAVQLLQRQHPANENAIYIVCIGSPESSPIIAYIGKAVDPWQRWNNGHLRKLREAAQGSRNSSYTRWVRLFESTAESIYLILLSQSQILFPPIAGFPSTVGAIEYQLIALAQDCFHAFLLNREGAAR